MTGATGPEFITLLVSDLGRSYQFYTEKLGLQEPTEEQPDARR